MNPEKPKKKKKHIHRYIHWKISGFIKPIVTTYYCRCGKVKP